MSLSTEDRKILTRGLLITGLILMLGAITLIFHCVAPVLFAKIGAFLGLVLLVFFAFLLVFGLVMSFLCMPSGGYDDY